jgi:hypothetical protein
MHGNKCCNSGDRNVLKKEAEILKYKDLITEIQPMLNVKTKVIPVIIRATETISNHSDNTIATYQKTRN